MTASPVNSGAHRNFFERARRPNRDHMAALRSRMPYWWVVVVLVALASWQILLNPFGFSSLVQRYTQDISNLLITGPYVYGTSGHDQIAVAQIDDNTLTTTQSSWPWSYGMHARVLDALRLFKPKAVIVDFLFVDSRKSGLRKDPTLNELITEIRRYQADKIPIYFESGTDEPLIKPIAKTGVRILDPTIMLNQGIARQYPVTGVCLNHEKPNQPCWSLALSVYDDFYRAHHADPKLAGLGLQPLDANPDGVMELVWGTRTDPINRKWMSVTDESGKTVSCDQNFGALERIYLAFFDTNQVRMQCPYTSVIPVESLLSGRYDADVANMAGRIVFYGGGIEAAQDKSYTPVNGPLMPDVFIHAMALDNLITFKGRPEQDVIKVFGASYSSDPVQIAAIIPVIMILSWFHMQRVRRKRQSGEARERSVTVEYVLDKAMEIAWHWLAFALALGAGLALTLASGLSVANWVEVVFVSVEMAALLLVGLPDALWGYVHHVAGGVPDLQTS